MESRQSFNSDTTSYFMCVSLGGHEASAVIGCSALALYCLKDVGQSQNTKKAPSCIEYSGAIFMFAKYAQQICHKMPRYGF